MDDAVKKDTSMSIYTIGIIPAILCYCYFICSTIPKGFSRLICLLPIFSLFAILPLRLLSAAVGLTLALFVGTLISIKLADQPPTSKPPKKTISWSYIAVEYASFAAVYALLLFKIDELQPVVLLLLYCSLPLLAVDCLGILASLMLYATLGLDLKPSSDKPYLATSLQDFWGKRWNHAVNNCLRCSVYLPVRSKSAAILGKRWARLVAVLATFLVSGFIARGPLILLDPSETELGNDFLFRCPRFLCCLGGGSQERFERTLGFAGMGLPAVDGWICGVDRLLALLSAVDSEWLWLRCSSRGQKFCTVLLLRVEARPVDPAIAVKSCDLNLMQLKLELT